MMNPLLRVPPAWRGVLRAYLNSEQEADAPRARELCARYGIDYDEGRRWVRSEINAAARAQRERWKDETT